MVAGAGRVLEDLQLAAVERVRAPPVVARNPENG